MDIRKVAQKVNAVLWTRYTPMPSSHSIDYGAVSAGTRCLLELEQILPVLVYLFPPILIPLHSLFHQIWFLHQQQAESYSTDEIIFLYRD